MRHSCRNPRPDEPANVRKRRRCAAGMLSHPYIKHHDPSKTVHPALAGIFIALY